MPRRVHPRWVLVGLAALFVAPIVAAWLLARGYAPGLPQATVNRGSLVGPIPLPDVSRLEALDGGAPATRRGPGGAWRLLTAGGARCDRPCERALWAMRQARFALGRDRDRVARMAVLDRGTHSVAEVGALLNRWPGVRLFQAGPQWPAAMPAGREPWTVYVVDPGGRLVLAFAPDFDPRDLLKDIKRLLKAEGPR